MYLFARDEFDEIAELEESLQDKRKKYYAMIASGVPFGTIGKVVENEINIWGLNQVKQMYQAPEKTKRCGLFCHR